MGTNYYYYCQDSPLNASIRILEDYNENNIHTMKGKAPTTRTLSDVKTLSFPGFPQQLQRRTPH